MNEDTEVIKETAKATQEVAKTTSNAIDAGREMGGFISRFISGPLEQGIGIFEDKLRYIRWERQSRLIQKYEEFLKQQDLSGPNKPIPLKNAVPFLEYATLEEDDYLQDMWARLLVNGTNVSTGINLDRSFIEVLAQISSLEAQILEAVYSLPFEKTRYAGVVTERLPMEASMAKESTWGKLNDPSKEIQIPLSNLARLGCLKFPLALGGGEIFSRIITTVFGSEFVAACAFKKSNPSLNPTR